jgi:Na+/H+-translocating membrane pyrophosphatase
MGSDLFGSFAEATVAALVVSGGSKEMIVHGIYFYPLIISASGIFVCLITTFFIPFFSIKASNTANSSI